MDTKHALLVKEMAELGSLHISLHFLLERHLFFYCDSGNIEMWPWLIVEKSISTSEFLEVRRLSSNMLLDRVTNVWWRGSIFPRERGVLASRLMLTRNAYLAQIKLFYAFMLIVYPQIHLCTLVSYTVIILYVKMIPTQSTNHVLHCLEIADAAINFDRYRLL